MGILSWIVLGLVVGILAKWIMPGRDGVGFIMTTVLGVVGAFVGVELLIALPPEKLARTMLQDSARALAQAG